MIRETFINENKTILDTNFYLYLSKCENNQKQLISFLKNKIKKIENSQEMIINEQGVNFTGKYIKLDLLNEILDFVNKSGKE